VQKDKQRSTKHTYKTKDRVTRTRLKTGGELRCSVRFIQVKLTDMLYIGALIKVRSIQDSGLLRFCLDRFYSVISPSLWNVFIYFYLFNLLLFFFEEITIPIY
jgi:hypothetical protein